MSSRLHWSSIVVALLVLLVPLVAVADDAYEEMIDLSNEAADAVADGRFEIGAVKFRQAYETYPDPILLNNEMIAWYRADDCQNALPPARQFLETEGLEPEDREDVESVQIQCHLRLAENALEEQNAVLTSYHLDSLEPLDLDADSQAEHAALREAMEQRFGPTDEPATATAVQPAPASSSQTRSWAQISGGIAVTGVGIALHAVALSRQSELRSLADSTNPADAQRLEQRKADWGGFQSTARWAVPALYTVGGVAIGSGVFFLMRDRSSGDAHTDSVAVSPDVGTDRVGLSLSGRF